MRRGVLDVLASGVLHVLHARRIAVLLLVRQVPLEEELRRKIGARSVEIDILMF